MEPLHSYNGVHYEEEHNKPHIVYRKDTAKKAGKTEEDVCETSGKKNKNTSMSSVKILCYASVIT